MPTCFLVQTERRPSNYFKLPLNKISTVCFRSEELLRPTFPEQFVLLSMIIFCWHRWKNVMPTCFLVEPERRPERRGRQQRRAAATRTPSYSAPYSARALNSHVNISQADRLLHPHGGGRRLHHLGELPVLGHRTRDDTMQSHTRQQHTWTRRILSFF